MQNPIFFRFFDVIVLFGSFQAGIVATLLYIKKSNQTPVRLFSLILLTLAFLALKIELHTLGLWNTTTFRYFPLAIDTLLPVLLYAYLRVVTGHPLRFGWLLLIFLPFILFELHALLVYFVTLAQQATAAKDVLAEKLWYNPVKNWEDVITLVMAGTAWTAGYYRLAAYRTWLYNSQSDSRLEEYAWLKKLLALSGLLAMIFAGATWLFHSRFVALEIFYVYLAGVSYYLALKGYQLYRTGDPGPLLRVAEKLESPVPSAGQSFIIERIRSALKNDRLYLQPELSLRGLAAHVGYPPGLVSAAINQGFGQNFRNLVNGCRVEAVKEMLKAPPAHLSLLGVALECGFNSEASFYRVFRQFTGLSPYDYQQKINAQKLF